MPATRRSFVGVTLVVFAAYLVAGKLGQATTHIRSSNLGPVWPAYGVALAAVILCGYRAWLGIIVSAFVVAVSSPVSPLTAAGQATSATIGALTGGFLLQRAGFDRSLSRLRDALNLIVLGALMSALVSASLGMAVLYATGVQAYSGIASAWLVYSLGDSTGVLLITPLALAVSALALNRAQSRIGEFVVFGLLLTLACLIIFGDLSVIPIRLHVLAFAVWPFVMWAAIRLGVIGVALSTLLVAAIATIETALGLGPFSQDSTFTNAILLDVFFAVLSVSGLTLAAVIAEREHAERERSRLVREQATLEAVRESEDKLRLILDSTAESIYGIDLDGRCTFCNPASLRTLGYDRVDQLLGKDMHQLIHHTRPDGTPYPAAECPIVSRLRTNAGVHVEDELLWRANGTSFPAECWAYPQLRGSEVVGAVVAFIDITQRKHAEQQAAALRDELVHLGRVTTLDALAGSLAHEINQPLTAVMANAEAAMRLMATAPAPPLDELREMLTDIRNDNQRAGEVVQRMKTLLKKGTTRYEPFDMNATVTDVVKLIRGNAISRRIVLDVELAPDLPAVRGDRVQVQQVVLNLLMNACDATQELETSRRRVSLQTLQRDQTAVVAIRDLGTGLPDSEMAVIFEPFYTTKREGMGLGLSICRAIVDAHGGTLVASRNADVGMTFSASFPFSPAIELSVRTPPEKTSEVFFRNT